VDTFLLNAQRIFDVARADGSGGDSEFVLLIRPDGGLQMFMGAAAPSGGSGVVYNVEAVFKGCARHRTGGRQVVRTRRDYAASVLKRASEFLRELLKDQPLYSVSAPLLM
jgi:hypothetical protein